MAAPTLSGDLLRTTEPATLAATALPFLSSTFRQFKTVSNSSIFGASDNVAIDLLMVLPRFAHKAASFAFVTVPEHMGTYGFGMGGEYARYLNSSFGKPNPSLPENSPTNVWSNGTVGAGAGFQSVRGFGGVFSYVTSPWAILCLFMAIALNRTQIYASLRRPLVLSWPVRLTLRFMPIILFVMHINKLLQAIRCQTSPDYSTLRYNNASMTVTSDFTMNGGALYWLSSNLLFYQSDRDSCLALGMIPTENETMVKGSLSLLWPLFQTLCLSQFIETLSCAVQARPVQAEMGMTIFEQSLAFAESEAMASNKVGWGPFMFPPFVSAEMRSPVQTATAKAAMMAKLNTPPEVLFIALISSLNHLSSHILGVFGWQGRFRLINSGIWGVCFMAAFIWGITTGDNDLETGLLRFPTVCIVGFIPHLLILIGIAICAVIYAFALILSTLSPPQGYQQLAGLSLRERLAFAHENLQANVQLSTLRINMHEEFYTTLLKIGFVALTAASEAVYLNEGRAVEVQRWTWLDEERMREVGRQRQRVPWVPPTLLTEQADSVAHGVGLVEEFAPASVTFMQGWVSPYLRERKTQRIRPKKDGQPRNQTRPEGAGRWVLAWEFLRGIFWLMVSWNASAVLRVMAALGIPWRPRWLARLDSLPKESFRRRMPVAPPAQPQPFVMITPDGRFVRWDDSTDVEMEMRNQMAASNEPQSSVEDRIDKALYTWWLNGGWWGAEDDSADWTPAEDDDNDDATSVITTATESDWEDVESDGRRTPTQADFQPPDAEESEHADFSALDVGQLASLLDPKSMEDRREARILARHLMSSKPLTRSAFVKDEAKILLSPSARRQAGLPPVSKNRPLTSDEEGILLEQLLLSSRFASEAQGKPMAPAVPTGSSWEAGAPGLGSSGPQCVVCQSSPRTIIIWPCRCLALCEDCRVSLAMNNFATCVCCRRDVVAFSRIFVP